MAPLWGLVVVGKGGDKDAAACIEVAKASAALFPETFSFATSVPCLSLSGESSFIGKDDASACVSALSASGINPASPPPHVYACRLSDQSGSVSGSNIRVRLLGGKQAFFEFVRSSGVAPSESLARLDDEPVYIFVGGDRSQVGKSSVCLGLLGALARRYGPLNIAYIKPATQCEAPQLVTKYCKSTGIDFLGIGPIVFYSGFTRAFLDGKTSSSDALLASAKYACQKVGKGKMFVVVDGVGYPSVGSIVGASNADVARVIGAPVVIVGKKGVGDAVDSFNLNRAYFEDKGKARVIGTLFNRLSTTGYYSLEKCKRSVEKYFDQYCREKSIYGFIPEVEELKHASPAPLKPSSDDIADAVASANESQQEALMSADDRKRADLMIDVFEKHIDAEKLIADAVTATIKLLDSSVDAEMQAATRPQNASNMVLSRKEIQSSATASGAKGG